MTTPKRAFHPEIRHRLIISGLSVGEGTNVLCVCMYCIYRTIYILDYSGLGEASENGPFWAPFPPCTLSPRRLTALRIWNNFYPRTLVLLMVHCYGLSTCVARDIRDYLYIVEVHDGTVCCPKLWASPFRLFYNFYTRKYTSCDLKIDNRRPTAV